MLCFNEGFLVVRFPFMLDFLFFCLLMEVSYSCQFPLMFCNLHWRFGLKKKKVQALEGGSGAGTKVASDTMATQ